MQEIEEEKFTLDLNSSDNLPEISNLTKSYSEHTSHFS